MLTVSRENGADPDKWTLYDENSKIWVYGTELTDIGQIFLSGGEVYADKQLSEVQDGRYTSEISDLLINDLQFFSALPAESASTYGNDKASSVTGKLYLRCDSGNPGSIYSSIEFAERPYIIALPTDGSNITIDNLCIKYGGAHGIGGGGITGLTVQNCEVAYIGGGIQLYNKTSDESYTPLRYGNGIEVNNYCDGYTVNNCWIHDIYDVGITHQQGGNYTSDRAFENISYTCNLIENCTYSIEYFASASSDGSHNLIMKNVNISDNIMRNAGSGFGADRNGGWNMSAHIMGWFNAANKAENFVIRNNIFDKAIKNNLENGNKINSSMILVSAENASYLPDFESNTYIHYDGASFAYYGENVEDFNESYFEKYSSDTNVSETLGDTAGKEYLAQ